MNNSYTIDDIKHLDFREGVRTRIQMYLGSDDIEGTYQAFKEILNNATDESLMGYGDTIEIEVDEKENLIKVKDYGRGVPFGKRENGENVLVSIYTDSHTGGKFDNSSAYKNSSGLNGIGASCVCLSSLMFKVQSTRDGILAEAIFKEGELQKYTEHKIKTNKTGTSVEFIPDPKVFKNGKIGYSYNRIIEEIHNLSYLYPNVSFEVSNANTGEKKVFKTKNGIVDFVKDNLGKDSFSNNIMHKEISDGKDKIEIAFQWGSPKEKSYVFVNGLLCPEGGSPITGAKGALTRTFNSLASTSFSGDVIRQNLFYVINCSVQDPSFANQTKSKINNENLRTLSSNVFSEALKDMKKIYPNDFDNIVNYLLKIEKAEKAASRARAQVLNTTRDIEKNQKKKVFNSDKLKDAEFLGQNATLLLVEGNSAAGSMTNARNEKHYGVLGLRGKPINPLSNSDEKIFANEEIKLLLSALGIVPGKYNPEKLRYGRVAICSDADSDGSHIGLLIMAIFRYLAPQFLEEGRLYWLRSPLYIVKNKRKEYYYYNDEEYQKSTVKGEVTRAKGLGALSAEQAHNSMFTEEFQRMEQLIPTKEAIDLLEQLMGENVEPRREYIFNNIDFSEVRE